MKDESKSSYIFLAVVFVAVLFCVLTIGTCSENSQLRKSIVDSERINAELGDQLEKSTAEISRLTKLVEHESKIIDGLAKDNNAKRKIVDELTKLQSDDETIIAAAKREIEASRKTVAGILAELNN